MRLTDESYGMPGLGAVYAERRGRGDYRRANGARCPICGAIANPQPATSKHDLRVMETPMGAFVLRPPHFAICKRCWPKVAEARWAWDIVDARDAWAGGIMLAHGIIPHSPELMRWGHWELELSDGRSLCPLARGMR